MNVKSIFYCLMALNFILVVGCAGPYKILKKDNSVIESENAKYTGSGFAYQKAGTSAWDTVKAQDAGFMARGTMVSVVSPEGKLTLGNVDKVELDAKSTCMNAKLDAICGHPSYAGAYWGNWSAGLLIGLIGIIPAAITASSPVSEKDVKIPDTTRLADQEYKQCLVKQTQRIKSQAAWSGWVGGWCLSIAVVSLILTLNTLSTVSSMP